MLQAAWQRYGDGPGAAVQLNFVNSETICRLHAEYFNDPSETDVITFPLTGPGLVGEIYVCIDKAVEQAGRHRVSVDEELARLALHGVLHLLGFDDLQPKPRRRMRDLERRFLREYSLASKAINAG